MFIIHREPGYLSFVVNRMRIECPGIGIRVSLRTEKFVFVYVIKFCSGPTHLPIQWVSSFLTGGNATGA